MQPHWQLPRQRSLLRRAFLPNPDHSSHDVSFPITIDAFSMTQASADQFSAVPHTSRAAITSTPQACLPPLAAMHSALCGRQLLATSLLPYSFVLAAQPLVNQAVAEDDELACSRETDGARGTEEALSTRRPLWMVKGLRSLGHRPGSKNRGMTGRGEKGVMVVVGG